MRTRGFYEFYKNQTMRTNYLSRFKTLFLPQNTTSWFSNQADIFNLQHRNYQLKLIYMLEHMIDLLKVIAMPTAMTSS